MAMRTMKVTSPFRVKGYKKTLEVGDKVELPALDAELLRRRGKVVDWPAKGKSARG